MKRLFSLLSLGLLGMIACSRADSPQFPTFAELIQKNGTVGISDGSSLFIFSKDGSFSHVPVNFSGVTVDGHWVADNYRAVFTITGNWGWENGMSPRSDPRKMVMVIYPENLHPKFKTIDRLGKPLRIYDCYFEIEELVKTPAAKTAHPIGL